MPGRKSTIHMQLLWNGSSVGLIYATSSLSYMTLRFVPLFLLLFTSKGYPLISNTFKQKLFSVMKMHQNNHWETGPSSCNEILRFMSFKGHVSLFTMNRSHHQSSGFLTCLKQRTIWRASTTENDILIHCCKFYLNLFRESNNSNTANQQILFSRLCATGQRSTAWLSAPLLSCKGTAIHVSSNYVGETEAQTWPSAPTI